MKKLFSLIAIGVLALGVEAVASPVFAQSDSVAAARTAVAGVGSSSPAKLQAEQKKADAAIKKRIDDINKVIARTGEMTRLSDADKATIQTSLQTIVSNLTALGSKIDAETDPAVIKSDVESVIKDFRVYALVIPRTHIIAAADRMVTIAGTLNIVGQKLSTRVAAASGPSVAALQTSLQDMSSKIIDAQEQAQSATQLVASLQPDGGDPAITKSNAQALKDAQAKIKAAHAAIITAQKDARAVEKGLKKLSGTASSTTPTTVR